MSTLVDVAPILGLRITAGPLELRGITDDLLAPLADLAVVGIHDADAMPFFEPWSMAPPDELRRNFAQYHWRSRASFSPKEWCLDLAVLWEGQLVGCQGFSAKSFAVTRTGRSATVTTAYDAWSVTRASRPSSASSGSSPPTWCAGRP